MVGSEVRAKGSDFGYRQPLGAISCTSAMETSNSQRRTRWQVQFARHQPRWVRPAGVSLFLGFVVGCLQRLCDPPRITARASRYEHQGTSIKPTARNTHLVLGLLSCRFGCPAGWVCPTHHKDLKPLASVQASMPLKLQLLLAPAQVQQSRAQRPAERQQHDRVEPTQFW